MAAITLRSVKGSPLTNNEVDDNFDNLNTDKYQSGDSVSVAGLTVTAATTFSGSASITAAGSIQGTATVLTKTFNVVTTATADQGVILPDSALGLSITVVNTTAYSIKIYPYSGDAIDSLAANTAKSLAAGHTLNLVGVSTALWRSLQQVLIYDSSGTRIN
jgi:hypothetical protein